VLAAFGAAFDVPVWILEALFAGGVALAAVGAVLRRTGVLGGRPEPPGEGPAPPTSSS
jgi:hypothetical protein